MTNKPVTLCFDPLDLATEMNDPRLINAIKSKGGKTAAECTKLDAT